MGVKVKPLESRDKYQCVYINAAEFGAVWLHKGIHVVQAVMQAPVIEKVPS